jgi:nitrite reductase/ring-hydroxylating ferredoxin subunit
LATAAASRARTSIRGITTGAVIDGPATQHIDVYAVQQVEGEIQIRA